MELIGSRWTDFHEIWCLIISRKSVEKIPVHSNLKRMTGTLHEDLCTFMIIFHSVLLRMFQTKVVEKIKTYTLCSTTLFFQMSLRLRDNVEKFGSTRQTTDDNITWHMRFEWRIIKARTQTPTQNVQYSFIFDGNNDVRRRRLSVTL